jgi:hypothetical protein
MKQQSPKTSPIASDTAFVLWFRKVPILRLGFVGGVWELEYTEQFKAQSRLLPIVCFPAVDKVHRSGKLWPFFSVRIPSIA